jgi:hypothetical protein
LEKNVQEESFGTFLDLKGVDAPVPNMKGGSKYAIWGLEFIERELFF